MWDWYRIKSYTTVALLSVLKFSYIHSDWQPKEKYCHIEGHSYLGHKVSNPISIINNSEKNHQSQQAACTQRKGYIGIKDEQVYHNSALTVLYTISTLPIREFPVGLEFIRAKLFVHLWRWKQCLGWLEIFKYVILAELKTKWKHPCRGDRN